MKQVFLIKLSGESMSGRYGTGLDFDYIEKICSFLYILRRAGRFNQIQR